MSSTTPPTIATSEQDVLVLRCVRDPLYWSASTRHVLAPVNSNPEQLLATQWECYISRNTLNKTLLELSLEIRDHPFGLSIPEFKLVHIVPHCSRDNCKVFEVSDLMGGKRVTISEKSIMTKDNPPKYKFDLVLSTSKRAPASPAAAGKSFRDMFPERYQDMLELLKDPGTVNVAFVFTIHSFQHTVALWAHRILLNKYPRFRELVDVVDNRPVSVPVEGISLTTFCVLLKYLYTGDLELTVDPTQFLICDMSKLQDGLSKDATTTLAVLNESLKQHNAAQFYATWSAKDKVTWSDIFLAADRFEMAELRQLTLDNLIASVDESNAMEILFGVGVSFKEEIYKPVMNYITEHLQDVFSIQTEDPFKRFADHSNCHEVMLELLRLSLSK